MTATTNDLDLAVPVAVAVRRMTTTAMTTGATRTFTRETANSTIATLADAPVRTLETRTRKLAGVTVTTSAGPNKIVIHANSIRAMFL